MYRRILVPVDNSPHARWAVERAVEICRHSGGRITGNHVYAARLHDVRFRQLETGLPAQFQEPAELQHQRRVHDKLIEKGLQLISDSYLDQTERLCTEAGVPFERRLLEGTNFAEILKESARTRSRPAAGGRCPVHHAPTHDLAPGNGGQAHGESPAPTNGRPQPAEEQPAVYDLVALGAHGIGRQPASRLGGVASRVVRELERDVLVTRDDRPLAGGRWIVCVDGSAYAYRAMRIALEMAREFGATLFVCSAFDVEFHHAVFGKIKKVLSSQAAKVFKFEEQEALHNTIIDRGMLRLCQANLKRALAVARDFPGVAVETQVLIGKPFQCILQWIEELDPSLLVLARHGSHRIEGTSIGSQAEELVRLAPTNVLLVGAEEVAADEVPWIEEDGEQGLDWSPTAEVRILRTPPFAQGIARKAVEEFVVDRYGAEGDRAPVVTDERLDEAIADLLPTHMQMIMGIGTAEELALAEIKAEETMARTEVAGSDDDPAGNFAQVTVRCPHSGAVYARPRTAADAVVWSREAFERLGAVPLIARPLARNTVERFAAEHGIWRVTTRVMDENKQAMIAADEFDADTMLVMFRQMQGQQLKAVAEGVDAMSGEMRAFIDEAKASGAARCPVRDIADRVDERADGLTLATPDEARHAAETFLADGDGPA